MAFIDELTLYCRSGRGGAGFVHFRRERFVPRGGPDGGDGGRGGSIILQVDPRLNTLIHLRGHPHQRADNGKPGGVQRATGRSGPDRIVPVPPGTLVWTLDDWNTGVPSASPLADLTHPGEQLVVAPGGRGGLGNAHFTSSTRRTPQYAQPGEDAVELTLRLELRVLADVGLLGYPNAGKSTLLSRISAARPRIADYPFTTLEPKLGIVQGSDWRSVVVADIPGLIDGAAQGRGLGNRFLRHVERCRLMCHLISLAPDEELPPLERYHSLRGELEARARSENSDLDHRNEQIVLSKSDTVTPEQLTEAMASFEELGHHPLVLSAVTGEGLQQVREALLAAGSSPSKDD